MKLKEAWKSVSPKCFTLLKWFLLGATLTAVIGIFTALTGGFYLEARYLTILAITIACQGVWGAVLFDCIHRRIR